MSQVSEWANTSQQSQTLFSSPYVCPDRVKNEETLQALDEKRNIVKGKSKGKDHPITGQERPRSKIDV